MILVLMKVLQWVASLVTLSFAASSVTDWSMIFVIHCFMVLFMIMHLRLRFMLVVFESPLMVLFLLKLVLRLLLRILIGIAEITFIARWRLATVLTWWSTIVLRSW